MGLPVPDVLEDFGSYAGPALLNFYRMHINDKNMKTFDVIEAAGRLPGQSSRLVDSKILSALAVTKP